MPPAEGTGDGKRKRSETLPDGSPRGLSANADTLLVSDDRGQGRRHQAELTCSAGGGKSAYGGDDMGRGLA